MALDFSSLIETLAQQPRRAKVGDITIQNHSLRELVDAAERVEGKTVVGGAEAGLVEIPGARSFKMIPGGTVE